MGAHPAGEPVMHRTDLEVDALERAEGALDLGEALVGEHRAAGVERFGRHGWCG